MWFPERCFRLKAEREIGERDMEIDLREIPMQKKAVLTERFTLAVEESLKRDLMELRYRYNIDVQEWIRDMIRKNLTKIKKIRTGH